MTLTGQLIRSHRGASVVEFALVAPIFLMTIFGLLEYGRLVWTRQAVAEAAFTAARCASMATKCETIAKIKTEAVTRAGQNGVTLTEAEITPTNDVSCNGYTANRVVIRHPVETALPSMFTMLPGTIDATACFPSRAVGT